MRNAARFVCSFMLTNPLAILYYRTQFLILFETILVLNFFGELPPITNRSLRHMKDQDFHDQILLQNVFLLENIQGGIVYSDYDPPFNLRYVTEGMEHLSGYSREELLSMNQMDLVFEEDIATLAEDVGRQFAQGDTFAVEYRLKRKDGSLVYVLDRAKAVVHEDGNKYIHCLLTDITELKHMEQALRLSEEKYKIAMQQSGYAILEYAPTTGLLQVSENFIQTFGGATPHETLAGFAQHNVTAACTEPLCELFAATVKENTNTCMELEVIAGNGCSVWCALCLTPLSNANGAVYAVLGCLQNIDVPKRRMQELLELSQKDGLTNTYNRVTIEAFVNQHLAVSCDNCVGALIILDIDNFKKINDTVGHDGGDAVLVGLVDLIRSLLRAEDLFGRLGGDEFLIFMPGATHVDNVAHLAKRIVEKVRATFSQHECPVTVSLGGALCTPNCPTFKNLYKNADIALYKVKNRGRNGFSIFNES